MAAWDASRRFSRIFIGLVLAGSWLVQSVGMPAAQAREAGPPGLFPSGTPYALQVAVLHTISLLNGEHFGYSVDISGDFAVVGAPDSDTYLDGGWIVDTGLVYVFHRDESGNWEWVWTISSPTQAGAQFGYSVAIDGDNIIVGAPGYDSNGEVNMGIVYIYEREAMDEISFSGSSYYSPNASQFDYFGYSVDIQGGLAVVGAYEEDCSGCAFDENSGSAFIFRRDPGEAGSWSFETELRAASPQAGARFGSAVATDGQHVIIGACWEDFPAVADGGAAYIFSYAAPISPGQDASPDGWTQQARLTASDAESEDRYGFSVDIEGSTAAVGAIWEDGGQGDPWPDAGAAYVYTLAGGPAAWGETAILHAEDILWYDYFGAGVSLEGDRLAVSAYLEDGGPADPLGNAGAIYLFERNRGGEGNWGQALQIHADDRQSEDRLGIAVGMSGDLIIGGAYLEDGGAGDYHPDTGAAYIFELTDKAIFLPVILK